MSIALALSLIASLTYGTSDFFAGLASRRLNVLHATAGTYLVATVAVGVGLLYVGGTWSADAAWLGALAGLLAVVGFVAFYAALAIGPMSLLSPAIALLGGIVPVVVSAVTGQTLGAIQWLAITVAVIATVLISVPSQRSSERVTVRAAVFEPPPAAARQGFSSRRAWILAMVAGLLLGVSNSLITIALHEGNLAVVSVLVSLYPLATVVLAAIVLRERLSALQVTGIALAIVASVVLALG